MNRNRLLELYLANGPLGMIQFDMESRVVAWSPRCEEIFGWPESDVRGKTLDELGFVHAPDRDRIRALTGAVVAGAAPWNTSNNRNVRRDGTVISCRWFNASVSDDDSRGFVSFVEDISEAARALDVEHAPRLKLQASEERFRSIFDNNPDAMVAFDTNGTVTRANVAAGRMLGLTLENVVGLTIGDLIESADMPKALAAYNRARGGIAGGVEFTIRRSDGEPISAFVTMIPIQFNGEATGVDMHVRDLRSQLAQQRHLQKLAYTDTVTALPNRAWLIEQLRSRIIDAGRESASVGVLFLDLDHFKDINDTLGHESGDRLLRIVGERLTAAIRVNDTVARMGGDEFVVLAVNSPDTQALAALSDRIIAAIEAPVEIAGGDYFVTTSIGVASFPDDGIDAETLVKHADVAMYRAKERGRNTYQFFTPALNVALQTRLSQEKALRKALEAEEFTVYYQPQHDLFSGEIIAVEALVRWNHPGLGLMLPSHFIPNAELSGLIVAMGDFVLETACRDIGEIRRTIAPGLRVTVNLSARQFHQQRLAAKIAATIERTGIAATALEMEITETVAMNDAALTVSIMRELGAGGVRLSVDDFGTGYSSLGYLRRFPLDSIKIDQSFVTDLPGEADDATIVRTVIAMAHALDLEVVAEGVETLEQLAFLRAERCDRVQGFLFSPAIPRDELERYIVGNSGPRIAGRRATPIPG